MIIGDVVQFNERHKWCGSLGIVTRATPCGDDVRYMVGVPMPMQGTAYVYTMQSRQEVELIGRAVLMPGGNEGV